MLAGNYFGGVPPCLAHQTTHDDDIGNLCSCTKGGVRCPCKQNTFMTAFLDGKESLCLDGSTISITTAVFFSWGTDLKASADRLEMITITTQMLQ